MCITAIKIQVKEYALKALLKEQKRIEKAIDTNLSMCLPIDHLTEALHNIKDAINATYEVIKLFKGGK